MLLKTDEPKSNMLNITKRKLMTLANGAECLSSKIDNWVSSKPNNNYRRLRSSRISKSCQTMIDHPPPMSKSAHWSYEDTVLLENWMADKPEPIKEEPEDDSEGVIQEELENDFSEIEEPRFNSLDDNTLFKTNKVNFIQPIIRMDGDIIEIEYCCDDIVDDNNNNNGDDSINNNINSSNNLHILSDDFNSSKIGKQPQEIQSKYFNSDIEGKQHNSPKIPSYKIADNRGLSPRRCQNYREFLVKHEDNNSPNFTNKTNTREVGDTRSNDNKSSSVNNCYEINNSEFDDHRSLSQTVPEQQNGQKSNFLKPDRSVMYERGGSTRIRSLNKDMKSEIKSFLSFRCPNKNKKIDKKVRKKYVTGEEGAAGPIWPAVLLTYDRGVSPGPPDD